MNTPRLSRFLPHPARAWLLATGRGDPAREASERFSDGPSPVVVQTSDALELLLDHSDIDLDVKAAHITPLSNPCYYLFGETPVKHGWGYNHLGGTDTWVEGCYLFPETTDGIRLGHNILSRHGLMPTPCRRLELVPVFRRSRSPTHVSAQVEVYLQDPAEPVPRMVQRSLQAEVPEQWPPSVTMERIAAVVNHVLKLALYVSGQPESTWVKANSTTPPVRGLPSNRLPFNALLIGPQNLESILPRQVFSLQQQDILCWKRGRFITKPTETRAGPGYEVTWYQPHLGT